MELKRIEDGKKFNVNMLLIAPYGIETTNTYIPNIELYLLIAPYGIGILNFSERM